MFMRNTLKMAIQSTGDDASSLNGMAKAPHKMINKATRTLLILACQICFGVLRCSMHFSWLSTQNTLSSSVYQFSTSLVERTPLLHPRLLSGALRWELSSPRRRTVLIGVHPRSHNNGGGSTTDPCLLLEFFFVTNYANYVDVQQL